MRIRKLFCAFIASIFAAGMLASGTPALADEIAYQAPTSSISEVELLPPEAQQVIDTAVPQVVHASLAACAIEPKTLDITASCELGRLAATNTPVPQLQLVPGGLPLLFTNQLGRPWCDYRPWDSLAQYCEGVAVLSRPLFGEFGSNQALVGVVIKHEIWHYQRAKIINLYHANSTTEGTFHEEQWADFGAGVELAKQLEAGLITPEEVNEAIQQFNACFGNDYDPEHGTKRQRLEAFLAGLAGDWTYLRS